jgi:ChrR Cupin-like domain
MNHNADFDQRVIVHTDKLEWIASPMKGVDRRMLDRIGEEIARATSVVRYAPDSHFSPHVHTGGEEFLVLEGVFQDEHGDYPVGSYVRNPPQSSHTPGSGPGCVILVKLWQFDLEDRQGVRLDTSKMIPIRSDDNERVSVIPLFKDLREEVRIEIWEPDTPILIDSPLGLEVFVLDGDFEHEGELFRKGSWIRWPCGDRFTALTAHAGARVWTKRGHLSPEHITAIPSSN